MADMCCFKRAGRVKLVKTRGGGRSPRGGEEGGCRVEGRKGVAGWRGDRWGGEGGGKGYES